MNPTPLRFYHLLLLVILFSGYHSGRAQNPAAPEQRDLGLGLSPSPPAANDQSTGTQPTRPELVLQTGLTSPAGRVMFSPDGKTLVSGSGDGGTRLWSVESGAQLATLVSLNAGADWLVVTPDGLFDATARPRPGNKFSGASPRTL